MPTSLATRAFDQAAGPIPAFCATCCGPRTDVPVLLVLQEGEDLGTCPACSGVTMPDGRSARVLTSEGTRETVLWTRATEEIQEHIRWPAPD